jgi:hypothetical protein
MMRSMGNRLAMFRRLALILGVVAMSLALNGCTKCGPIWDDWMQSPKSCKSDLRPGSGSWRSHWRDAI